MSHTQIDTFLDAADAMSPAAYAALFRLTAGSGIRIDEARHFELGDINSERQVLTITPKRGQDHEGLSLSRRSRLGADHCRAKTFLRLREKIALDDKTVWREVQRVHKAARVPRMSMHDLRRAWASAMHANGASLKQVSVWLGHADIATTERYIRVYVTETHGHEFLPR